MKTVTDFTLVVIFSLHCKALANEETSVKAEDVVVERNEEIGLLFKINVRTMTTLECGTWVFARRHRPPHGDAVDPHESIMIYQVKVPEE